jgi:glycosyltransferase involved in cell wall biosynthesis
MKVLLVNKFLYPKGGDAISTLTTGELLAKKGHDVHFWGMDHPDNPSYPLQKFFISCVDYNNLGGVVDKTKSAVNILYSFEAKRKISLLLKIIKPDIIHLNNFAHQITPSILDEIKKYNIPTVMTMRDYKMVCPTYSMLVNGVSCEKCKFGRFYHCALNRCSKGSLIKSLINVGEMYLHHKILRIYDKIDVFIAPSRFLMDKVKEMGMIGEVVHLSNCVDIEVFQPAYGWQDNSIVYLGRLSHEKGVCTLIDAVKDIKKVRLKIVGDGPLKGSLQGKIQSEKITNVNFLGYKAGQELHEEIRRSMFLVIPSECYENNPRSVIEAFALGKPAIGARIGGIPELVQDWKTGLTYTSGDVDDLKDKIQLMLNNADKISEMGQNARRYVEDEFTANVHYNKLISIYDRAKRIGGKA